MNRFEVKKIEKVNITNEVILTSFHCKVYDSVTERIVDCFYNLKTSVKGSVMVFAINDIETCDSELFETGTLIKNNAIEIETDERRICFYDLADCM